MSYTAAVNVILQRRPAGEVIHCSIRGPVRRHPSRTNRSSSPRNPSSPCIFRPRVTETGANNPLDPDLGEAYRFNHSYLIVENHPVRLLHFPGFRL
jgi:hypothetical protein